MKLLGFLTRRQAWLTPEEIAKEFRLDGARPTARTIHRWFRFLREHGDFKYYPYPRANVLGLQDVLVRMRNLRNPDVAGILPFASSFNVEIELGRGEPVVSQSYWVPGAAIRDFQDFWRTARDIGLVGEVDLLRSRNTHYIFSPFDRLITRDGRAELRGDVDNRYFEGLIKRDLSQNFEVGLGEPITKAPLIIPIAVEHIWAHYSSRQVWQAIKEKGETRILEYAKRPPHRAFRTAGAALRLLQQQWTDLVRNFDEVFLQPRISFDWVQLRDTMFVGMVLKPGSPQKAVEAAVRMSERSISTALKAGVEFEERCHINCFIPSDQFIPILEMAREQHRGHEPPSVTIMNRQATLELFKPTYCKLDWRLFDPSSLTWRFDTDAYFERLKTLAA